VKTKLLNPIGVSEGILADCRSEIKRRTEELDVDVMTLRLLTSQTEAWERELKLDVIDACMTNVRDAISYRAGAARRVLDELSYIDRWKLALGMGSGTFDGAWERSNRGARGVPIAMLQAKVDRRARSTLEDELLSILGECFETLSSRAQTQGMASLEYLGKRPAIVGRSDGGGINRMVGHVRTPSYRRLFAINIADVIQDSTSKFPIDAHCAKEVYRSLYRTALLSSLLVGTGAMTAALSVIGYFDVINGLASLTLAGLGGVCLPLGNRYLAVSYEREWMNNTATLEHALDALFSDVMRGIKSELSASISPYSRYVSSEVQWLKDLSDKLEDRISTAQSLRSKINKSCD
jgi:hypothetical protein